MSGILLNIVIPEYSGEYENAMRRLVELCQNETLIFDYFFSGKFTVNELTTFATTIGQLVIPDHLYSIYVNVHQTQGELDPVKGVVKDLIYVCQYLIQFYRGVPFVERLRHQSSYLNKQIKAVQIFEGGLTIAIV